MQKVYSRINWENEPSTNTPLSEDNLNKMDYALDQIDNRVVQLAGYQDRVSQSEKNAKTSEENAKVSEINAKESEEKAKEYMESAFKGTPEGYQEVVEKVDSMEIKTTKENTIKGTKNGGFRLTKVVANTIQNGTPSPSTPIPMLSTGDCVEMMQGYYDPANSGVYRPVSNYKCSKHKIPCKSGDVIKITADDTHGFHVLWYNENAFVDRIMKGDVTELSVNVPSGVTHFAFNTGELANKITITINGKYLGCAKTHGKNVFDVSYFADSNYYSANGNSLIVNKTDLRTYTAVKTFMLKPNTKYVLSVQNPCRLYYGKDFDSAVSTPDTTATYLPFTTSATGISHFKFIADSYPYNVGWVKVEEVEEYREPTEYVPFGESIAYFLTTYPMIKGSTLFRENGLVKAMHTTTQQVFNGDESIYIYPLSGENVERFYINIGTPRANFEVSYCSHLPFMAGNDDTPHYRWSSSGTVDDQIMMFIPKNLASTVDEFKAWLASNPVTVMWSITPIIETLDTASQVALNGLETFEGVTYVEFDTRVQPLEFEAEVGLTNETARLLKNELRNDTLEVKYNELAVAMVSL